MRIFANTVKMGCEFLPDDAIVNDVAFAAFLSRLAGGDTEAWNLFIRQFNPLIGAVAGRASNEHADDIVQEIYLTIVKGHFKLLRSFDDGSRPAFIVYLKRICENTAKNFLRKQRRRQAELGEALEYLADERETPEAAFLREADLERLTQAIAELRVDYQNVLNLLLKGYRHREVAQLLDIPLKTSLTWAHRATTELRKSLKVEIILRRENILS